MHSAIVPELQPETGLFDSVWAYFLQDYDDIEDDKSSFDSSDETLSVDEYEPLKTGILSTKQKTIGDEASEESLKKSNHHPSLKRSAKLLEYSRRLDHRQPYLAQDRSTILKKGVVNNKVVKNKKYLPLGMDKRDSYIRDNFRRTEELLAYSRIRKSGRKRLVHDKPATVNQDVTANKKSWGNRIDDRDSKFRDNADADAGRDGPPGIIFIEKDHLGMKASPRARQTGSLTTHVSRNGIRDDGNEKPLPYIEERGQIKKSNVYAEKKVEDYNAVLKRREIRRKISLLRMAYNI